MEAERFVRLAGAAGMLGGLAWVVGTAIHASRPVGCVGEGCASTAMRQSSTVQGILGLVAFVLMAVTGSALVMLARRAGRLGALGKAGTALALVGVSVLMLAIFIQAVFFAGDFPLMPYFVIPGIAGLVIGVVLLALAVLRADVVPRWAAAALLIGALSMLAFNEQTAAAWFGIPFGVAWMVAGYALWTKAPTTE